MKKTLLNSLLTLVILVACLLPMHLLAQNIAGIWKGTISTTDKQLQYELAITEDDGKFSGYSYTTFFVKGVEMSAVKAIKVLNENGSVTVIDNGLIYNNFQDNAAKEIKQTDNLLLNTTGEVFTLTGKFNTKGTRQFRPLTGDISLHKEKDTVESKLLSKLDSLQLKSTLSFIQTKTIPVDVTVAKVVNLQADAARSLAGNAAPSIQPQANNKKIIKEAEPIEESKAVAKVLPLPPKTEQPVSKPIVKKELVVAVVKETAKAVVVAKPAAPRAAAVVAAAPVAKPVNVVPKPAAKPAVAIAPPKPIPKAASQIANAPSFTAELAKRNIETIQTVYFKTDSLLLTLYDNGEVDGDTVSVILNGRMIMAKQGLSTKAITQTIYITPDMGDSLQLVMYAENLGSLPPNTGLLIINDGKDRYEIRFAGDLTKNAAIALRRRKQQ